MQENTLEIHTISDGNLVKVISIKGPKKSDLRSKQGFFVPDMGNLFFAGAHRPEIILREGAELSREAFEKKKDFITGKITELHHGKKKPGPIMWLPNFANLFNADKVKETGSRMKKQRKENTGIIVTVTDAPMPVVVHVQALSVQELPLKYLLGFRPKVWQTGDKLFYKADHVLVEKGKCYSAAELEGILQHIQLAGDHLAEVNKKVNNKKPNISTVTFKDGKVQRRSAMP